MVINNELLHGIFSMVAEYKTYLQSLFKISFLYITN